MLPGSFTRFDPGASPLPVLFKYPSVMSSNIELNETGGSAGILGRINRCGEDQLDGNITLGMDVRYGARTRNERDNWYAGNKEQGLEIFATTEISGETVEFLTNPDPAALSSSSAMALIPYDGETGTTYHLTEVGTSMILVTSDIESPTETCTENLRATLKRTVESLEANEATTFEQYFDF
jgi:hypothetical protein